jgi:hypothetical protein
MKTFRPAPSTPILNFPYDPDTAHLWCVRLDDRGDLCVYVWGGPGLTTEQDAAEEAEEYANRQGWEYEEEDVIAWGITDSEHESEVLARTLAPKVQP